jgi:hypothetical protein
MSRHRIAYMASGFRSGSLSVELSPSECATSVRKLPILDSYTAVSRPKSISVTTRRHFPPKPSQYGFPVDEPCVGCVRKLPGGELSAPRLRSKIVGIIKSSDP